MNLRCFFGHKYGPWTDHKGNRYLLWIERDCVRPRCRARQTRFMPLRCLLIQFAANMAIHIIDKHVECRRLIGLDERVARGITGPGRQVT